MHLEEAQRQSGAKLFGLVGPSKSRCGHELLACGLWVASLELQLRGVREGIDGECACPRRLCHSCCTSGCVEGEARVSKRVVQFRDSKKAHCAGMVPGVPSGN